MKITLSRREYAQLLHNCGNALARDECEACVLKGLCGKGEYLSPVDAIMNLCEVEEY